MTKKLFFVSILLFCSVATMLAQTPSAEEIMNKAAAKAKLEKKNIIVIFHASWCGWCHKMDRSMNDPICKEFFDNNYVTVHMVVDESKEFKAKENPGADEFRKKYGGNDQGIPFWLVFDKDGKLLADSKIKKEGEMEGQNSGCPASAEEVDYFISVLEKTSRLNNEQLSIIHKRFRENESK